MAAFAIIGGSGFGEIAELKITRKLEWTTPFGKPSAPLLFGEFGGEEILFLPRHGEAHGIPPHQINYRANLWALKEAGAKRIIGMGAVGGIRSDMTPGRVAIPHQIIDYTWGREQTFFEQSGGRVEHIDFTNPYCETLRAALIAAGRRAGVEVIPDGVYGATQGPRLESAMEIRRMRQDGCDLVGMTGMPEAALARELELDYAACAVVANPAAGLGDGPIAWEEIKASLDAGMARAKKILLALVRQ